MLQALAKPSKSICPSCGFLWCCHCKAKVSSLLLPPAHTNPPFPAPLGREGHTGPLQSFHHPHSRLPVFLYAACAYSLALTLPPAPGLLGPTENESLVISASSRTTGPAETILLRCYPSCHPHWPSTAQRGVKASSQLVSTSRPGVEVSPASPAARSIFSAYSAVTAPAEPRHNLLNPVQQERLPQGFSSSLH